MSLPEPAQATHRPRADDSPSVDADELARFARLAEAWWDPLGQFRPLHRLNPVRLAFVRQRALAHFGRDSRAALPLAGLEVLDIGCGGGLLCEPLARLGAKVTGIDAEERGIAVARAHAEESGLAITYRTATAEELVLEGPRFDIVLNMEVVEHVADVAGFLAASLALLKPAGMMVLATLNRTPQSFALAIVGAEYILRWLPRGTHDWRKFLRPSELAAHLRALEARLSELVGVRYSPLTDRFTLSDDLSVNYMALVEKS
ncbi:MAG: bifunctional 2-polyprenyl-6-hydroxyphenol methylase/3-demethylubiquinol 3-O-methyltransferase UbiG [Alphaproteobacteria bacterium]